MKTIMLILSIVLIMLGLLMLFATPAGLILIAIGVVAIIYFNKRSPSSAKPEGKKESASAPSIESSPQKSPETVDREPPAPVKAEKTVCETFRVAGVIYHLDEIMSLAEENPCFDYSKRDLIDDGLTDERVYEYTFSAKEVELVDEPENEADPNAIKVIIDGHHVGYIKKGSTGRIRNLRKQSRIKRIEAEISGGKYKIVFFDMDDDGKEHYEYEKDESPIGVKLTLYLYPEKEKNVPESGTEE